MAPLSFDFSQCFDFSTVDNQRLATVHAEVHRRVDSGELPFLRLHEDTSTLECIKEHVARIGNRFDDCVVLGIGGSSLGGRALINALGGSGLRVHFPDNVDPETFGDLLDSLDWDRTLFNCISKSGGTLETISQLMIVMAGLEARFDRAGRAERLILTTGPDGGFLRRLAERDGLPAYQIPPGVGGRFSVFTPVGLLPAALAGVDIDGLAEGMAWATTQLASPDPAENPAMAFAAAMHGNDIQHGRPILYTVPYADRLKSLGDWFAQLWAESLGKAAGGPTPITAVGATDQHSQLQRWMDGAPSAVIGFLEVQRFRRELVVPDILKDDPQVGWMAGLELGSILKTELVATRQALSEAGQPSFTATFPAITPQAVAAWMTFMEAATAYAGELYGLNTFDQPGVEAGKVIARGLLDPS